MKRPLAALGILCGLLFALVTTPADAATGVSLGGAAPRAGATASASSAPGAGIHTLDVITCTGQIDNPHKSTHFPGTVNVEASVRCTAPVFSLNMETGLYRNGVLVGTPYSNGNTGSSALAGAFATPCVTGTYIGAAAINVIFPPGYVPPAGGFIVESPPIPITC